MFQVINVEEYSYSNKCYAVEFLPYSSIFYVFADSEIDALDELADWFKEKNTFTGLWDKTDENTGWEDDNLRVFGNESDVMFDEFIIRVAHPIIYLKFSIQDESYEEEVEKF